jgi:hypothetical protein
MVDGGKTRGCRLPRDTATAPPSLDRECRLDRELRNQPDRLCSQQELEIADLDQAQADVIGDNVALEKRHRRSHSCLRHQEIDTIRTFVKKTKDLQPPGTIEKRRHLRRPLEKALDV